MGPITILADFLICYYKKKRKLCSDCIRLQAHLLGPHRVVFLGCAASVWSRHGSGWAPRHSGLRLLLRPSPCRVLASTGPGAALLSQTPTAPSPCPSVRAAAGALIDRPAPQPDGGVSSRRWGRRQRRHAEQPGGRAGHQRRRRGKQAVIPLPFPLPFLSQRCDGVRCAANLFPSVAIGWWMEEARLVCWAARFVGNYYTFCCSESG